MAISHIEFTEYHTPDGLIYHFDTQDRFLLTETGLGMPPIEYITQTGPFQHGESIIDYRLKPRVIQLQHRENSCSRDDYWDNRANWLNMLRPNRNATGVFGLGKLRKYLSNGATRDIDVIIEEGPAFAPRSLDQWDEYGITETLRFVAPDPTFYDPVIKTATWALTMTSALIFPFTFPTYFSDAIINSVLTVNYNGTWPSFPVITVAGPLDGLTIENISTGEQVRLLYSIDVDETVTISLAFGNKTVTSDVNGNLIGTVVGDLATFHIAPDPEVSGGVNNLSVVGTMASPDTEVAICWYERYIGI